MDFTPEPILFHIAKFGQTTPQSHKLKPRAIQDTHPSEA